ncbi:type III secretion system chaperone [Motiliproteus sp. MSK22-1]|uniref:type III secretion system chaperone n=1 Tax=Motiliproteus sp. MSK22-1 TaxID=1897630 RepID=UPI00097675D1|nr:type III secretion system chaperone [Motiliproteus sp. MSK22-1]OMH25649.1 hypothetical protein BGP75_24195 [Motiliproteus sp. MSK22-1]
MSVNIKKQELLSKLSEFLRTPLKWEGNVCSLQESSGEELVVIEIPDAGDNIILHCLIDNMANKNDSLSLSRILNLNYDLELMKGCWLAANETELRLFFLEELELTNFERFNNMVMNFVSISKSVRSKLRSFDIVNINRFVY